MYLPVDLQALAASLGKPEPPKTWHYRWLKFSEGLLATTFVCGLVLFEIIYVGGDSDGDAFLWGLGVSIFFFFEIVCRFYVWDHCVKNFPDFKVTIGGFFTNPFRFLDSSLVIVDVTILIATLMTPDGGADGAKASVKLGRAVRLTRVARWMRGIKMLKGFRVFFKPGEQTKLGRDIIIRSGDPTSIHDLVRCAAHKATSIAIMMTSLDEEEARLSDGRINNSATIRTVLTLRNLIYSNGDVRENINPELRVVVHLQQTCNFIDAACFVSPSNEQVVFPLDLNDLVSTIMFKCPSKPGLSRVLSEILDFSGCAIRCREASQVYGGEINELGFFVGKTFREATLCHCWEDGSVIGIDDRELRGWDEWGFDAQKGGRVQGITAHPNRVILADDWIIFVSRTSNPQAATENSKNFTDFRRMSDALVTGGGLDKLRSVSKSIATVAKMRKKATKASSSLGAPLEISNDRPSGLPNISSKMSGHFHVGRARRLSSVSMGEEFWCPRHILVLGWRPEWDDAPAGFRNRLRQILEDQAPGSTITCLTFTTKDKFHKLITKESNDNDNGGVAIPVEHSRTMAGDYSAGWFLKEKEGRQHFLVKHHWGDSANFDCVSSLIRSHNTPAYDVAVCLGSTQVVPGREDKAKSQSLKDTRVLSTLLILRKLTSNAQDSKWHGRSMHIVAETCLEQTEYLAVRVSPLVSFFLFISTTQKDPSLRFFVLCLR